MDKEQILRDYRAAKNNKRYIQILADLNACSKDKIIEILWEGGYKMIFNTNGVDVSLKFEEISALYQSGKTIKDLSNQYHVSAKAMREVLGIPESEVASKAPAGTTENTSEMDALRAENEKLRSECKKLTKECDYLNVKIAEMEERNKSVRHGSVDVEDIHEKYQSICIRNSQLNATVDTLIDKISMLKAVGCCGR